MKELAIIGYGRFGKLAAKILKRDFKLYICDKNKGSVKTAASKPIILLAVPTSAMEKVVKQIKHYVKKDTLVIDVCTVKEYPAKLMKNLPCETIGTHPLFGPDSVKSSGIKGKKIVVCPIKSKRTNKLTSYLKQIGLNVIKTTAKHHDKELAETLCFAHFIGRGLIDINIGEKKIDTLDYKRLLKVLETVKHDTKQLFYDIHRYNRYTKKVREKFIDSLIKINKKIKQQ